jgi:hypothetical protein
MENNSGGWKGMPMSLVGWFVAGIGLTLGYQFTHWILGILHLR